LLSNNLDIAAIYLRTMNQPILTLKEQIDRAITKEGRKQHWIVEQLTLHNCKITEAQFSRKKNGINVFSDKEIIALSKILNTQFILN